MSLTKGRTLRGVWLNRLHQEHQLSGEQQVAGGWFREGGTGGSLETVLEPSRAQ